MVTQLFEEAKRKDPSIVEAGGITLTQFQDIMEKSKLQGVKINGSLTAPHDQY